MNTIKEQLKIFLNRKGISPTALEREMNWGVGAFTKAKSITSDRLAEVLQYFPELSADWLLRGEGEMLKSAVTSSDMERLNTLVDTIATLQKTINSKDATIAALTDQINHLKSQIN